MPYFFDPINKKIEVRTKAASGQIEIDKALFDSEDPRWLVVQGNSVVVDSALKTSIQAADAQKAIDDAAEDQTLRDNETQLRAAFSLIDDISNISELKIYLRRLTRYILRE